MLRRISWVLILVLGIGTSYADSLDYAVSEINHKVAHCQIFVKAAGTGWYDGHLAAMAALEWTVGRVSAPAYGYRAVHGLQLPVGGPTDNEVAVSSASLEVGICGNAEAVMGTLMRRCGYQVRKIDVWYDGGGHTFIEVSYGNKWRAYDPTYGVYWVKPGAPWWDVASAVEVAEGLDGDTWAKSNASHLWGTVNRVYGSDNGLRWWAAPTMTIKTGDTVLYQRTSRSPKKPGEKPTWILKGPVGIDRTPPGLPRGK